MTAVVEGIDCAVALAHETTDPSSRAQQLAALIIRAPNEQEAEILRNDAISSASAVAEPAKQADIWRILSSTTAILATGRPTAALARLIGWPELVGIAPAEFVRTVADELAILGVLAPADA